MNWTVLPQLYARIFSQPPVMIADIVSYLDTGGEDSGAERSGPKLLDDESSRGIKSGRPDLLIVFALGGTDAHATVQPVRFLKFEAVFRLSYGRTFCRKCRMPDSRSHDGWRREGLPSGFRGRRR